MTLYVSIVAGVVAVGAASNSVARPVSNMVPEIAGLVSSGFAISLAFDSVMTNAVLAGALVSVVASAPGPCSGISKASVARVGVGAASIVSGRSQCTAASVHRVLRRWCR